MRLKTLLATLAVAAASMSLSAQTEFKDPVAKAVMDSYEQMLKNNPKDYQVYFRRANEYYNHNMYSAALADINSAIDNAPAKEKDIRFQCLSLRASIFERMDRDAEALKDINEALAIDPSSYALLYQKANIEFVQGDYSAARADYQKLQRLNPRSQEALFGLARVAVKENDHDTARRMADEAVSLAPAQASSYMNRASLRKLMGDNAGAVDDYLVALDKSRDSEQGRPVSRLIELSNTDYNAVMQGLNYAIQRAPRAGINYFLRGTIAQSHHHYPEAVADYNHIIQTGLLDYAGVYRQLAECLYALGQYDQALENADMAIGSSADNTEAYVVKSNIKRAMGANHQAVVAADRALAKNEKYAPALMAKSLALAADGLAQEANIAMGNAALAAGDSPYYNLARAWSLANSSAAADLAPDFYNKVIKSKAYPDTDPLSFKGFAYLALGDKAAGDAWAATMVEANDPTNDGGEAAYYAACYYTAAGDKEKAFEQMSSALRSGYANYYNWTVADEAGVSVAPLRDDPRFDALMKAYAPIFKTK